MENKKNLICVATLSIASYDLSTLSQMYVTKMECFFLENKENYVVSS